MPLQGNAVLFIQQIVPCQGMETLQLVRFPLIVLLEFCLQQLGYTSYVRNVTTAEGMRWRVYAGPVVNRDAADRLRASIADSLHIGGLLIVRP